MTVPQYAAIMDKLEGIEKRLRKVETRIAMFVGAAVLASAFFTNGHVRIH